MPFEKGNDLWNLRGKHGRSKSYKDCDTLWKACYEYFEWAKDYRMAEHKIFHNAGEIVDGDVQKMKALTKFGLCAHIGISHDTWSRYSEEGHDFCEVAELVNGIIHDYDISGAAAGLLNSSIVARLLGMAEKTEQTVVGEELTPWSTIKASIDNIEDGT